MASLSILLATYNGEKYIDEQISSLLNQTYQDFICLIHDDGSSDNTISICEKYEEKNPEKIRILKYPAVGGAKENFLSLMEHVETDYVMLCDQDDVWLPDKLEKMISRAKCISGDFLVFCDLRIVDEKLNIVSDSFYRANHIEIGKIDYKNALIKGFVPGCSMMMNKGLVLKALRYQNVDAIKMHDWWIVLTALMTDAKFIFVDEPLVLYRQHPENTIGAKNLSTIDRVQFNLKRLLSGSLIEAKKRNIQTPRLQGKELFSSKIGTPDKLLFVKRFSEIGGKNKFNRIAFYLTNFHSVYRLWWMLIWV